MQNFIQEGKNPSTAGETLRFWRKLRRISQMDLALDIDVSAKHLSFVETGKSKPSRSLVLKLADALKLPLRHRNAFLMAAGHAPEFGQAPFDGQKMNAVRDAMQRMMENHAPYPAFVVDTGYRILMKNAGYDQLVAFYAGAGALDKYENAMRILFAEDGLRPYVKDWPVIEKFLLNRLWEETNASQDIVLMELLREISKLETRAETMDLQQAPNLPVMSLILEKAGKRASFFTTIATLGTAIDVTAQELRIEMLFPSDEETRNLFPLAI